MPYPASSLSQMSPTFCWGGGGWIQGSVCVKTILGGVFEGCFFFIVGNLWGCIVWVCVWSWVGEGIPSFTFLDFYILWDRGSNLGDCAGYVKVVAYVSYCIHLFYSTYTIILVMYA